MSRFRILICLVLFGLFGNHVQAQFYRSSNLSFGRSRIQYSTFHWSFYRIHSADIYYYPQSQSLALFTAHQADSLIRQMEKRTHYQAKNKLQIIVFAKYADYRQSNIQWNQDESFYQSGFTPLYNHKILIYNDGDMRHFQEHLQSGIAQWMVNQLMLEQSRLGQTDHLPIWFKEGAGPYFADIWNEELYAEVQDGFRSGRYGQLLQLPKAAQINAGNSFWRFIAHRYGADRITPILQVAALTDNFDKAFESILLKKTDQLLPEWEAFYRNENNDSNLHFSGLLPLCQPNTRYDHFATSQDGRFTAFTTNKEGQSCIYLLDRTTNRLKRLSSRHYRVEDFPDYSKPLLLWQPDKPILSVIDERNARVYLRHYHLQKNRWGREQVIFVEKVTGAAYADNGKLMALTALQNGQSDLFLYDLNGKSLTRITNDSHDVSDPCFVQHDQVVVVCTNRPAQPADTLPKGCYNTDTKDLFAYHIAEKNWEPLTRTPTLDERQPIETESGNILYITNYGNTSQHCIGNLIQSLDSEGHIRLSMHSRPIHTYASAIIRHAYQPQQRELMVSRIENGYPVISTTTPPPFESIATATAPVSANPNGPTFPSRPANPNGPSDPNGPAFPSRPANPNSPAPTSGSSAQTLIPRIHQTAYGNTSLETSLGPDFFNIEYQQFTNTTTPLYLNSGVNLSLLLTAKDLMEDHRLSIGGRVSFNLRNREFLFSYEDLSKRWDRQWMLYYQSIENKHNTSEIIKLQSASVFYKLGYPLDEAYTLHITPYARYNQEHVMSLNDSSLLAPSHRSFWIGLKGDLVADFTKNIGFNTRKGFRGKVFAEMLCSPFVNFHFLNVIGADFRHYQIIHRNVIWANRVAVSSSFGRDHLIYFLGGVDRWLNASFNVGNPIDSSFNYSYQTLATNMRGFNQNIRNGNSFFVWNTEVRFPFVSYFFQRDLLHPFLNSLQLVGFTDIGAAWHDTHLYHRILRANYQTSTNKQGPVAGIGFGFRANLLNYCLRLDYAWGLENKRLNKGIFYISVNSDF